MGRKKVTDETKQENMERIIVDSQKLIHCRAIIYKLKMEGPLPIDQFSSQEAAIISESFTKNEWAVVGSNGLVAITPKGIEEYGIALLKLGELGEKYEQISSSLSQVERPARALVYAPSISFLPPRQQEWISKVNWQEEVSRIKNDKETDEGTRNRIADDFAESSIGDEAQTIVGLLKEFVNAQTIKDTEVRIDRLNSIAEDINEKISTSPNETRLEVNRQYIPGISPKDLAQSPTRNPYSLAMPWGIAGVYTSLAEFLAGEYVFRLKSCRYCEGLFIAPDDRKSEYCPYTNHRQKARRGYQRGFAAQKRKKAKDHLKKSRGKSQRRH